MKYWGRLTLHSKLGLWLEYDLVIFWWERGGKIKALRVRCGISWQIFFVILCSVQDPFFCASADKTLLHSTMRIGRLFPRDENSIWKTWKASLSAAAAAAAPMLNRRGITFRGEDAAGPSLKIRLISSVTRQNIVFYTSRGWAAERYRSGFASSTFIVF